MKKVFVLAMVAIVLMSSVLAKQPSCEEQGYDRTMDGGIGSPDNECIVAGFDFGVAKWEWEDGKYVLSDEGERDGYVTNVAGSDSSAAWTSTPGVDGVLSKEGQCYQDLSGGTGGMVEKINYGISHITLCGNGDVPPPDHKVPEFTTIGAGIALVGAGLFIARRKSK